MIKKCNGCGQSLSWSKFFKDISKRDGLHSQCKVCILRRRRLRTYNLTEREYTDLVQRANGHCAICGISSSPTRVNYPTLNIDHCHATLKVRGLLCFNCNNGLGCFKDNIETLNNAITYLEKECS